MSDSQTLHCTCGVMEWSVQTHAGTHVICYCRDCQSFATHLEAAATYLDPAGGTHLYQTLPDQVQILKGAQHLAVLRLSPQGLMRWYAGCCNTPLANTLPRSGIPFLGVVVPPPGDGFGAVTARAFTDSARHPIKAHSMARAGFGILSRAISGRISGAHRRSPFYDTHGTPVREPQVLTQAQRKAAQAR